MEMSNIVFTFLVTLVLNLHNTYAQNRRPFYLVAHMVNSIGQVQRYLDRGANAIETDIHFFPNGSVKEAYHGWPCDCLRSCQKNAKLSEFLEHVRDITNPEREDSYYERMVLQMLDLKLDTSEDERESGRDLARHVLDHLWSKDGRRKKEVRVVFFLEAIDKKDMIVGFIEEFKSRGQEHRLQDVGFDGGTGNLRKIAELFAELGVKNIWQGDGKTNCISAVYPDLRLRNAVSLRDSGKSNIKKVYHWTIDLKIRMRLSLNIGVDAMLTNDPEDLLGVINEPYYARDYRMATVEDDPFEKFVGN